ncbi:hypothetical protein KTD19_05130 [Burkholderia multivorans]|uniref:hypothetical protein n=1 Tax=Burkholderia multivorans TaxID=87883 RepID=UPI0012DDCA97|nr:hypothetical protein [Burkholderia multivorans]MBU9231765.1 hypothetical protein [Burkholderia multivorans]QGR91070.1 hypothetical protein FOC30_09115 [Burkholderia multivorans]HEF4737628.1 hypothetical protein [Burkholderia multivorans]
MSVAIVLFRRDLRAAVSRLHAFLARWYAAIRATVEFRFLVPPTIQVPRTQNRHLACTPIDIERSIRGKSTSASEFLSRISSARTMPYSLAAATTRELEIRTNPHSTKK